MEIPENVYEKIKILSVEGNDAVDAGEYPRAIDLFKQAFNLLPEPKLIWDAASWLLVALGETLFFAGNHEDACETLLQAMLCPGAFGNPFVHLRLGQTLFELGNMQGATDELSRAYMDGGTEVFKKEEPKYLRYIETVLKTSHE